MYKFTLGGLPHPLSFKPGKNAEEHTTEAHSLSGFILYVLCKSLDERARNERASLSHDLEGASPLGEINRCLSHTTIQGSASVLTGRFDKSDTETDRRESV